MKRILSFLIILLTLSHNAQAFVDSSTGYYYTILDASAKTCELAQGYKYTGDFTVPATASDGTDTYMVVGVGNQAFYNCTDITSVTFPDNITTLGASLFYMCSPDRLTALHFGSGIQTIDGDTFKDAGSLGVRTLTVSGDNPYFTAVSNILYSKDLSTLVRCPGYIVPEYPEGNPIRSLAKNAFAFYRGTDLTLPEGLTELNGNELYATLIERLTLPSTLTSFSVLNINDRNNGCSNLQDIFVARGNTTFSSYEGILYNYDQTELIACPIKKSTLQIGFPYTVTAIGNYAFRHYGQTQVVIPSTVETIGNLCFYNSNLTSVSIPDAVTTLGNNLFQSCSDLKEASFGEGITSIPTSTFLYASKLNRLTLGSNITSLNSNAFTANPFEYIECHATQLPEFKLNANNYNATTILAVPGEAIGKYIKSPTWSQIQNIKAYDCDITILDGTDYVTTDNSIFNAAYSRLCYYREFNNTKWQPLFVPFNMTPSDVEGTGLQIATFSQIVDYGAGVYSLKYTTSLPNGLSGNQVALIRADKAEAKVLIKNAQGRTEDADLEYSDLVMKDNYQTPTIELTFRGTYEGASGIDVYENTYYVMSGGVLARTDLNTYTSDILLKPQRWYMTMNLISAPTSAPSFRIESEDDCVVDYGTDMLTIDNGDGTIEMFFSLDGRHLEEKDIQNLKPGIYVQNGKKMMVK